MLTKKEAKIIEAAGYPVKYFLEKTKSDVKNFPLFCGCIKSKEDGSCIFLKFDIELNRYKCSIYDLRPTLCKLYPFSFESLGSRNIALKVIPCCRGER